MAPHKDQGIWYHTDGTPYANQELAESNADFRNESDELREAATQDRVETGPIRVDESWSVQVDGSELDTRIKSQSAETRDEARHLETLQGLIQRPEDFRH